MAVRVAEINALSGRYRTSTTGVDEKILTLNPEKRKKGVNISRAKYDLVKGAMLAAFRAKPELTLSEIFKGVGQRVKGRLEGSLEWYTMAVKLDLEARGVITRVPKTSPIVHRLKTK